jgi:hypothetical protein
MEPDSTVDDLVQELDIAEGLKQLLIEAGFTIESVTGQGYRELSERLHIDPYIGKLIVEAAQNIIQERIYNGELSLNDNN